MVERAKRSSSYHGHLNYEGEFRDLDLTTLGFYLQGKPDTERWRKIFFYNEDVPVEHNGRIFPEWAVLNTRQLFLEDPKAVEEVLKRYKLSREDIPPLE